MDTLTTSWYPVALISPDSVYYTDSICWDSISTLPPYARSTAPTTISNLAYFGDKVWGSSGSRLYYCYPDSVGQWGVFHDIAFNLDDGDEITAVMPDREYINIFKNRTQYVLYEDGSGDLTKKWTEAGRGCVAPFSVAWYNGNLIYLDETGVYSQAGNIYKDKGSTREALSAPIANLIDYSIAELKSAVGFVHRDKYYLSFPAKDSTYVYDFKVGGWSIYNYAFQQATHYDIVSRSGLVPSSDMLFITGEDSAIYKADTLTTDNRRQIQAKWESVPIAISPDYSGIDKVGMWHDADADTGFILLNIYNDKGSSVVTDTFQLSETDLGKYYPIGINTNLSNYFKVRVTTDTIRTIPAPLVNGRIDSVTINGFDIWLSNKGIKETE